MSESTPTLTDAERERLAAAWSDETGSTLWASLQNTVARMLAAARADERERIAGEIEAERNRRWQEHLRLHPYAQVTSDPVCHATHDALAYSVLAALAQPADTGADQ